MHFDFDENRDILDVPKECPKCKSELELDTGYDKTALFCTNPDCDYEIDVTEEFEKAAEQENEGGKQS